AVGDSIDFVACGSRPRCIGCSNQRPVAELLTEDGLWPRRRRRLPRRRRVSNALATQGSTRSRARVARLGGTGIVSVLIRARKALPPAWQEPIAPPTPATGKQRERAAAAQIRGRSSLFLAPGASLLI